MEMLHRLNRRQCHCSEGAVFSTVTKIDELVTLTRKVGKRIIGRHVHIFEVMKALPSSLVGAAVTNSLAGQNL